MPMPVINVQMPSADAPYEQPYASEYPYAPETSYTSEPTYASEHLVSYTPEHPYPFQQPQQPYYAPVSLDHTEPPLEPWVPTVPEESGEEEVDPTAEPVCIPTTYEGLQTGASVSRRPSRLQRFASFLGLRPKELTASRHS
jgi:hypothetical protein